MRIETSCDLALAWDTSTILGKIIIFPFLFVAWFVLLLLSILLMGIFGFALNVGLMYVPEENEETDSSGKEMED